ncbi:NUMOD1 domain-containing DNA-binding protein [Chryseobacterium sp. 22543]|uniref:NUMOD1 domain-containing DNA-binding protein n=1 Tax=Chryseobacterium sp. 22543 TaxID=3453940 RepID=UPI003F839C2F
MNTTFENTLPIFNFSLQDLPGEVWLPVHGSEDFALISQFGRVKRIPRHFTSLIGDNRYYGERIYQPTVKTYTTFKSGGYRYHLCCTISAERTHRVFNVAKMVYFLFNKPFPMDDIDYKIIPVNGKDLDIRPDNLELIFVKDPKIDILRIKPTYSLDAKLRIFNKMEYSKELIYRLGVISCYSVHGDRICTFKNITKASQLTHLSVTDIENAIIKPFLLVHGCYWRSGKDGKINTSLMELKQQQEENQRRGVQLTQFDLSGNPINYYYSIAEAAKDNGISETEILNCLHDRQQVAAYSFWKKGYHETSIPGI